MGSYAVCTAESAGREQGAEQAPGANVAPLHESGLWSAWGVAPGSTIALALGLDDGFTAEPPEGGAETADAHRAAVHAALADVDPQDEPAALAALALHFVG